MARARIVPATLALALSAFPPLGPAQADGAGLDLPADPAPPVAAGDCGALYAEYRALIDGLLAEARACDAAASAYARARYGRPAGAGACALRVVGACRAAVERCADVAAAMTEALARCRAQAGAGGG